MTLKYNLTFISVQAKVLPALWDISRFNFWPWQDMFGTSRDARLLWAKASVAFSIWRIILITLFRSFLLVFSNNEYKLHVNVHCHHPFHFRPGTICLLVKQIIVCIELQKGRRARVRVCACEGECFIIWVNEHNVVAWFVVREEHAYGNFTRK